MLSRQRAAWPVFLAGLLVVCGGLVVWLATQQRAVSPRVTAANAALRIDGIGPITIGMTREEADRVMGEAMRRPDGAAAGGAACQYGYYTAMPQGAAFVLISDVIARIDMMRGETPTPEGARIGAEEIAVADLYAGRASLSPHKYVEGHYITVTSAAPGQDALRYVFETENGKVTRYRSGRIPEVEYVEGCA
jgi:hypothetical protein